LKAIGETGIARELIERKGGVSHPSFDERLHFGAVFEIPIFLAFDNAAIGKYLGIPAKLNACSEKKPNGIPG